MVNILLFLSLMAHFQPGWAQSVRIGTTDNELELAHIPSLSNVSQNLQMSSPFDLVRAPISHEPYFSHGTLSFLTIFGSFQSQLGEQFKLVSIAQVGHFPSGENLGEQNKFKIGNSIVYDKQDGGQKFFDVHSRGGAQVIYIGWPLNAGNARIERWYLEELVRRNVILVEVAPALSAERGFFISDLDRYALLVGAVGPDGNVLESSRRQGVDVFCPAPAIVTARSYIESSRKIRANFGDTSAAAAVCTRYVAQLKTIKPDLSLSELKELLKRTAFPPPKGATAGIFNVQGAIDMLKVSRKKFRKITVSHLQW